MNACGSGGTVVILMVILMLILINVLMVILTVVFMTLGLRLFSYVDAWLGYCFILGMVAHLIFIKT